MSNLIGNPEDRFSCVAAHFIYMLCSQHHIYKAVYPIVFQTGKESSLRTEVRTVFNLRIGS